VVKDIIELSLLLFAVVFSFCVALLIPFAMLFGIIQFFKFCWEF